MSYTETHFGKAKKIEFPSEFSFKEKVTFLKKNGFEFNEEYPEFGYHGCEDLVLTNDGTWYELLEHKCVSGYYSKASRNDDGTIIFFISFYNGSSSFEEEFSDYIKKIDSDKNRIAMITSMLGDMQLLEARDSIDNEIKRRKKGKVDV